MNETSTIQRTSKHIKSRLTNICDNAALEAEILIAHILGQSRTYLRTYPQNVIDTPTMAQLYVLVEQRINGEPIAYIIGHREFWSLGLFVNKHTLIPRSETETLVACALEKIPLDQSLQILDLGTGSGAIALAVASERPNCTITATDISENALLIAKKNAESLSLTNVEFQCSNWLESLQRKQFDAIISNPPYIARGDPHLKEGDLRYEPASALQSGKDGLDAIKNIIQNARKHFHKEGWLLLEHGYDQREKIITLLKNNAYSNITWHDDIQGQPRVILAQNEFIT